MFVDFINTIEVQWWIFFLVVDPLCPAGYLDFDGAKLIDAGDAQQKLKDRGYF